MSKQAEKAFGEDLEVRGEVQKDREVINAIHKEAGKQFEDVSKDRVEKVNNETREKTQDEQEVEKE